MAQGPCGLIFPISNELTSEQRNLFLQSLLPLFDALLQTIQNAANDIVYGPDEESESRDFYELQFATMLKTLRITCVAAETSRAKWERVQVMMRRWSGGLPATFVPQVFQLREKLLRIFDVMVKMYIHDLETYADSDDKIQLNTIAAVGRSCFRLIYEL